MHFGQLKSPTVAVLCVLASAACSGSIGDSSAAGGGSKTNKPGTTNNNDPTPESNEWYETLKGTDCSSPSSALPSSRIWRLSAQQWKSTAEQTLGITGVDAARFPKDQINPYTGFSDDSSDNQVTLPLASAYFDVSGEVATQAAPIAIKASACLGTSPIDAGCAQKFVSDYGRKLFRRALTPQEVSGFADYLTSESKLDPAATAVSTVLRTMLLSPSFVYRTELGNSTPGPIDLTGDEIASFLSYTIVDAPPDAELSQAAAAGKLSDPTVRETQARRLLASPAAKLKLADFWHQYLALGAISTDDANGAAMVKETETFFDKVVWDKGGAFSELLTAKYTYVDPKLAPIYGTAMPGADGRLDLVQGQRSGFLTQASTLVGTAVASQTSTVIHRGLLVRERLLCEHPPPPPVGFVPNPAQIETSGPDATARENYDKFSKSMISCNACHSAFHPLGLAFETYDDQGRYRMSYPTGKPILTAGTLGDAGDANGPYANVVEMASKIGASQIGQYCFSKQFAQFALGRAVNAEQEACTVREMGDHVIKNGGAVRELFASLAHVDAVYRRQHQ